MTCAHCGQPTQGTAKVNGVTVCHPDNDAYPDCYRLVTVYGEPLGSRVVPVIDRRVYRDIDAFLATLDRL